MVKISSGHGALLSPSLDQLHKRTEWLDEVIKGFATKGQANRDYYQIILETLWPANCGIPGPYVNRDEIREAINRFRYKNGKKSPYHDVFRRVRELQGEEGILGIVKNGNIYQLQSLEIGEKRIPRKQIDKKIWDNILIIRKNTCSICGNIFPSPMLSPDHRTPRSRGGGNSPENIQPLCRTCNATKSAICQGCEYECYICLWAWPEKYKPIKISDVNFKRITDIANAEKKDKSIVANYIIDNFFRKNDKGKE